MRIDSLSLSSVHLLQEITRVLTRLLNFLNFIDQTSFCEWLKSETTTTFLWSKCIYTHSMHTEAERQCTGNFPLILTQII